MPHMKRRAAKKARTRPLRVSVVLAPSEHEALSRMASETDRSMSWLGRYAIRRLLEQREGHQLPLELDMPRGRVE